MSGTQSFRNEARLSAYVNGEAEQAAGQYSYYVNFAERVHESMGYIYRTLKDFHDQELTVVTYGATAKSTTLLNSIGIPSAWIYYMVDNTPIKQGLHTPGLNLWIRDPGVLKHETPDVIMLTAWNYAEDIMNKELWFDGLFFVPIGPSRGIWKVNESKSGVEKLY